MAKRPNEQSDKPEWIVYVIRGKRPAHRLGTVTAADSDAAIAKAIETFAITDPKRQRRVMV
jgi:1,2-phenylacetyl-CoA epoxidase PaaB subunit